MIEIQNPVLPGFHPDPSICKAGSIYYIAVSTFEWFPGVLIYRSNNLRDWSIAATPLMKTSQLNMMGNPPSGGVWAPCLSYSDGRFWLAYSNVRNWSGFSPVYSSGCRDVHNYLIAAESVEGEWSEPVYLNSSGFDPSLFHDVNGKKWLLHTMWDYRPSKPNHAGIYLQEYSVTEQKLIGSPMNIYPESTIGDPEGAHLYRKDNWYYLLIAEGGTGYGHAATIARSRDIHGPYELHPSRPFLSSVRDRQLFDTLCSTGDNPELALYPGLQKAGHGSLVHIGKDEWALAHLCARPLPESLACPLGRETAIQRVVWKIDAWPEMQEASPASRILFYENTAMCESEGEQKSSGFVHREDFNSTSYAMELQSLRMPLEARMDMESRPGWIALVGAESPESLFFQSILCRRVQSFNWYAETKISFRSEHFQQFAGLIVRYDERNQHILRICADDAGCQRLGLMSYVEGVLDFPLENKESEVTGSDLYLAVKGRENEIQFSWSSDGEQWLHIGPQLDASLLSDEAANPMGFTGMFVGLGCFDLHSGAAKAFFDYLEYRDDRLLV